MALATRGLKPPAQRYVHSASRTLLRCVGRHREDESLAVRLTFFHCIGLPGSGPGRLNSMRGVPALKVGVVSTSTAMTSQLRVMK